MNCYPAQSKDKFSKELSLLMRTLPIQRSRVSTVGTHLPLNRVSITYPEAQGGSKRQQIERSGWKV